MAGSYRHCCGGKFDRDGYEGEFTFAFIDNMSDAYEACRMMHWMIWHLADGDKAKIRAAETAFYKRPDKETTDNG